MMVGLIRVFLLNRYIFFAVLLYLYLLLADPLIELTWGILHMEVPFLFYLYLLLNLLTRPSRWQAVTAAVPLAGLYLLHDYYFLRFFRIPKLNDLHQLPELLSVAGWVLNLTLAVILLAFLYLMARTIRFTTRGVLLATPLLIVLGCVFFQPAAYVQLFTRLSVEVIHYATVVNVEYNGRFVTALYNEAKRRDTMNQISRYREIERLGLRLPEEMEREGLNNGRNVHMIILEGFLDPTLLAKLPVKVPLLHPDFTRFLRGKMGFSVSPVFGGYTSQAEFEILCGVPAFQEFDEIEFNVFTGAETYCLPRILHRLGYRTMASNGFKPDFFNTMPAYRGIGFDATYFAREYTPSMETYLSKGEDHENKYFFDAELFAQNLAFVKKRMEEKKPFLNYVLTVYGHFPFEYGSRVGPPVIPGEGLHWDLERILNQTYYRSKAVADYLEQLLALDPDSLIVVVSDHLPPLERGVDSYDELGYLQPDLPDRFHRNRFAVFRGGKPVKLETFYHFNIYRLILDYVTDGAYCRTKGCDFRYPQDKEALRDDYRIIMGLASRQLS